MVDSQLDNHLDELVSVIRSRIGMEPPEAKLRLSSSRLTVAKGPRSVACYCRRISDTNSAILIGSELYPFLRHYLRAAATYNLPSTRNGPRPSDLWQGASSALATTLEWTAFPDLVAVFPDFCVSVSQQHAAEAILAYAFRFAVCHEMAHIALGHLDDDLLQARLIDETDVSVVRKSQENELHADSLALNIQMASLPDQTQAVNGMAGAVYFIHAIGLLKFRLSVLAHLVDERAWKIAYSHPPEQLRIFSLMGAAERLFPGVGAAGIKEIHHCLSMLNNTVSAVADRQQDDVRSEVKQLVEVAVDDCKGSPANLLRVEGDPRTIDPKIASELMRLFQKSPLGVARAFEPLCYNSCDVLAGDQKSVVQYLVALLPREFQAFLAMSPSQRAMKLA
jgi:hypothetical protein